MSNRRDHPLRIYPCFWRIILMPRMKLLILNMKCKLFEVLLLLCLVSKTNICMHVYKQARSYTVRILKGDTVGSKITGSIQHFWIYWTWVHLFYIKRHTHDTHIYYGEYHDNIRILSINLNNEGTIQCNTTIYHHQYCIGKHPFL